MSLWHSCHWFHCILLWQRIVRIFDEYYLFCITSSKHRSTSMIWNDTKTHNVSRNRITNRNKMQKRTVYIIFSSVYRKHSDFDMNPLHWINVKHNLEGNEIRRISAVSSCIIWKIKKERIWNWGQNKNQKSTYHDSIWFDSHIYLSPPYHQIKLSLKLDLLVDFISQNRWHKKCKNPNLLWQCQPNNLYIGDFLRTQKLRKKYI